MKKLFLFTLFVFTIHQVRSQEERTLLKGRVLADSLHVENVHILNNSSNKVAITEADGNFEIPVKISDTLFFSNIQYEIKKLIIDQNHINNKNLIIKLISKRYVLQEVQLGKAKSILHVEDKNTGVTALSLGLPNARKRPLTEIEKLSIKLKNDKSLGSVLAPNLEGIYNHLTGEIKRQKKLIQLKKEDKVLKAIRTEFTDTFFIKKLNIPQKYIDAFLQFCCSKNIVSLYNNNKKFKLLEILMEESKKYIAISTSPALN